MTDEVQEIAGTPAPVELADVNGEVQNAPEVTAAEGEADTQEQVKEKVFTQAEVDALIQKRLLKEERRVHRRIEQQLRESQQAKTLVEPKRESFADDEQYLQAHIEHLAERRAAEKLEQRQQQQEQERIQSTFLEKAEKAAERYEDFDLVVSNPNLPINSGMAEFIAESDIGPDVAYFLGKNPAKAAQIAQLSPIKAARELTRIEAELASKPQAKPSKAPEPIAPVGNRGKASSSSLPSDDDDIATWMRKERERAKR